MATPVQIYGDNAGHSHEAACGAVFSAGYADGFSAGLAVANAPPPPVVELTPKPTPVVEEPLDQGEV